MIDRMGLGDVIGDGTAIGDFYNTLGARSALGGAPGGDGKFQVDLASVHSYYNEVYKVYSRLSARIEHLGTAMQVYDGSQITGVCDSMYATMDAAVGSESSLLNALKSAQADLAKHLTAVSETYTAYIKADDEHATQLSQAINGNASHIGYGGPSGADNSGTPSARSPEPSGNSGLPTS